jgi:hypothetical protein
MKNSITSTMFLLLTIFTSCSSTADKNATPVIDKKNYESVGKAILEAIQNKDTMTIINLYGKNWMNDPNNEFFFASTFELSLPNNPLKYIKTDTTSIEINEQLTKYINVYYKFANDSNSHYYVTETQYEINSEGNYEISHLSNRDLTLRCEEITEFNEPTTDYRIEQIGNKSPKKFYLYIRNGNECKIDSLVFKVNLSDKYKTLKLDKKITIKQTISPLKETKVTLKEIDEILNTADVKLTDLSFSTVYPINCLKDCDKIKELKSIQ